MLFALLFAALGSWWFRLPGNEFRAVVLAAAAFFRDR